MRHQALLAQLWALGCGPHGCSALAYFGANGGTAPAPAPDAFVTSLALEAERVRVFITSYLEHLWMRLLDCTAELRACDDQLRLAHSGGAGGAGPGATAERLAGLRNTCDALGEDLVQVEIFMRQNVAACAQLVQMHDRLPQQLAAAVPANGHRRQQQRPPAAAAPHELGVEELEGAYLACMQQRLLGSLSLDPLTVGLSDAYELLRLLEGDAATAAGRPSRWVPPTKFQRVTRKFWVHPADVMRLKALLIRHLPILIFDDRQKLTEGEPTSTGLG